MNSVTEQATGFTSRATVSARPDSNPCSVFGQSPDLESGRKRLYSVAELDVEKILQSGAWLEKSARLTNQKPGNSI
jgi:hypothetical protein